MQRAEREIVLPVTIGGIVEFYEIYLYAYWAPILKDVFKSTAINFTESFIAVIMFVLALISRPLGGLFFGYFGDRQGRRFALLLSIIIISLTSLSIAKINISSISATNFILYIGIIKFVQGFTISGEIPAAICLLSESAASERRKRYLCSYVLIGPQIGQILSMAQCLFLENYFSYEFLIQWGWRISFIIAGIIGFIGIFLRSRLHESASFEKLKKENELVRNPVTEIFKQHKEKLILAFMISIFEVAGFFMIAFFLVEHFAGIFNVSKNHVLLINILFSVPIIFVQPLIGKIAEKYESKPLYILSAISVICISLPFFFALLNSWHVWSLIFLGMLILALCIQFSLLPSLLSDMFPASVRFTSIGFSFNMCNSIIGGLAPLLGVWLTQATGSPASFVVIYPLAAIIFLLILPMILRLPRG